jgi:hypothetical protein
MGFSSSPLVYDFDILFSVILADHSEPIQISFRYALHDTVEHDSTRWIYLPISPANRDAPVQLLFLTWVRIYETILLWHLAVGFLLWKSLF